LIEAIEQEGRALLSQSGFQRYEISAWAKSGQLCQHNLNYWQFGDYIGLGPGAHSKLSLGRHTAVVRFAQLRHPQAWLQHQAQNLLHAHPLGRPEGNQPLTESDLVLEFFLNAFRLSQPPCHLLEERTGIHPDHPKVQQALQQARELKLLQPDCFQPTERGTRHLDHLIALFS
ncbi:MAG: radical SAM family heme chaperone HemW, partial [Gammaproteobacteria bacterium]